MASTFPSLSGWTKLAAPPLTLIYDTYYIMCKEGGRERERERDGGPYGPGSLTSSSNPKEEERERER